VEKTLQIHKLHSEHLVEREVLSAHFVAPSSAVCRSKKGAKHGKSLPDNVPSAVPSAAPTPVKSNSEVPSVANVLDDKLPVPLKRKAPSLARTKQTAPSIIATPPATPTNSKMSSDKFLPPKCTGVIHNIGHFSHFLFCIAADNVIQINTGSWKQPERITVAKFAGKMVGGKQHSGFEIAVVVDPRDAREGL